MVEVTDAALQQAAGEGMDAFIQVFTDAYKRVIGGELTADTMPLLTGEQHSLLAYQIFRDELMEGGFCQLVQNGYGGYIFANPFAKVPYRVPTWLRKPLPKSSKPAPIIKPPSEKAD